VLRRQTAVGGSNAVAGKRRAIPGFLFTEGSAKDTATFVVGKLPVRLEVFNLPAGVKVKFYKVIYEAGCAPYYDECCYMPMVPGRVVARKPYTSCGCTPMLTIDNDMMMVQTPGIYEAVIEPASAAGTFVLQFAEDTVTPCDETTMGCCNMWVETCEKKCVNNRVHQQEQNGAGAIRWVPTDDVCGYCPSVKLCPGYAYGPFDDVDPDATVPVLDTNGAVKGYIYPSGRPHATVPVANAQGHLLGYASNQSDCAADTC
jgi:hypothetical protein